MERPLAESITQKLLAFVDRHNLHLPDSIRMTLADYLEDIDKAHAIETILNNIYAFGPRATYDNVYVWLMILLKNNIDNI